MVGMVVEAVVITAAVAAGTAEAVGLLGITVVVAGMAEAVGIMLPMVAGLTHTAVTIS